MKNIFKNLKKVNIVKSLNLQRYTMPSIILASIVVFMFSNYLLSLVSLRLDLSQGHAYTLSNSSRKLINDLKKPVTITFFVSSDIPAGLQPLKREVVDFLQEYDKSSGNVTVKIIDPKVDANAKKKADEAGIQELPFQSLQRNQYQVVNSYFGLLIEQDKQKEVLPQVTDVESLEYNITASIYKMTRKELPLVGVVGFQDMYMPNGDPITKLKQVLESQFTVETIPLPIAPPTPDQANFEPTPTTAPFIIDQKYKTVMVFASPSSNFGDKEVSAMKQYLERGGRLIVFANGITIEDNIQTGPASKPFMNLLKQYGIEVKPNLALSTSAELVNFGNQNFALMLSYPFWLKTNQFNPDASYFSGVAYLTYPWTSSLVLHKKDGIETKELVRTTKEAWTQEGTFVLDPQKIPEPNPNQMGQQLISVEAKKKNGGNLMVIGSARFVEDRYISDRAGNLAFVLNVLNDYASGGALSGIRQRAISFYPLPDLPKQLQTTYQYSNILLLPGLFALYGFFRLYRRGKSASR